MYKYNYMSEDDKLIEALKSQSDKTFRRTYKETPCLYKSELLIKAIASASKGKIAFLIDQVKDVNKSDAFIESVYRGDIEIISLLHSHGFTFQQDPFDVESIITNPIEVAITNGSLEVLICLHSLGYPLTVWAMHLASVFRHSAILEYLIKNNCPRDDLSCYTEATGNIYMQEDFCFSRKALCEESYRCSKILHDAGFKGIWPCERGICPFCLENKIDYCIDLWILENEDYTSSIQWLPREMLDDICLELEKETY
jgi:hypothetical protein